MHADSVQKMHMDSCMRAYSTVQQFLCHGGYCELILSLAWTSCRLLFTARPTTSPLAGNPLRDVVRSRHPSKSTLAHDAVATLVSHKNHSIIRVGAGLIQSAFGLHSKRGHGAHQSQKSMFAIFHASFQIGFMTQSLYYPRRCNTSSVGQSAGLSVLRSSVRLAKTQKTENPILHGFEIYRPSGKGTKSQFQVIKVIINQ